MTDPTKPTIQTRLKRLLEHPAIDAFVCMTIMCNTVFVAVEADYTAQNLTEAGSVFKSINLFFLVFFALEILIRVVVERQEFILGKNRYWNAFDSLIVSISSIEHAVTSTTSNSGGATRAVRVLRLLRLIRIARLLRVIRFLQELRAMVMGILQSASTLLWALLLLIMNMFVFAVYVTQIVAWERIEISEGKTVDVEYSTGLQEHFHTLLVTIYSLYKAVTGGNDWHVYADLLFEIGIFPGFLFCFYIAFTTFAVLNVVSGVFISHIFKLLDDDTDLTIMEQTNSRRKVISDLKNVFRQTDSDRSGKISRSEFCSHIRDPCAQAYFRQLGLEIDTHRDWDNLFDLLDFDCDQQLDIDEFVSGCLHMRGPARSLELERCNFSLRHVRHEIADLAKHVKLQNALFQHTLQLFQGKGAATDELLASSDCISHVNACAVSGKNEIEVDDL
eukprot:gnl/MRDRNA2_/MRDRNA2_170841_c0_seq1.p1 gnl/MRDRNA2_/MRDRNA2_170841_c0~~gnl/MRDRNA2_/MRDRNA2_170841_c0_seq1.p1  ORF type:complete len:457 (-),score=53.67 gnl/MRDRNA2_/MRDRNA2_170841_c0_seq1:153-1490(-)